MEAGIWTIWDRNPTSNELKQTNMYKVGDKVKVRSDLTENRLYGKTSFNNVELKGKIVTINYVDTSDNTYKVSEDISNFWWDKTLFEDNPSNKLFKLM